MMMPHVCITMYDNNVPIDLRKAEKKSQPKFYDKTTKN